MDSSERKALESLRSKVDEIFSSAKTIECQCSENNSRVAAIENEIGQMTRKLEFLVTNNLRQGLIDESRALVNHVFQLAVFLTSLTFATYALGIAIPNERMQMWGTVGLYPSIILLAVYVYLTRKYTRSRLQDLRKWESQVHDKES